MAKKKVVVNRKFLNDLANRIYNPKTKQFLRLCDGKLTNGPDPTNESRRMHCGLGELYFAITGRDAGFGKYSDRIDEGGVINLAFELSTLKDFDERERAKAVAAVKALKLPQDVKMQLIEAAECLDIEDIEADEKLFRKALSDIPGENDDGCGHSATGIDEDGDEVEVCTPAMFRERSKRVAKQLRLAAKYLPE